MGPTQNPNPPTHSTLHCMEATVLIVIRLGRWLYWAGFKRCFPFEMGAGREASGELSFGISLEIV